jgi:CRISPR system Cascade subunit CasB
MNTVSVSASIYEVTENILNLLTGDLSASSTKAYLASLRRSVSWDVPRDPSVFSIVFANIPDKYLGESGELTVGERSIVLALQLFALHQQGKEQPVHAQRAECKERGWGNLGASLRALRAGDATQAADRRFNAMITATTFNELANHLRHLIKLLKSKTGAKVNYAQLAQDLYWFQLGYQSDIRLKWSRDYYRHYMEGKGEESDEEQ